MYPAISHFMLNHWLHLFDDFRFFVQVDTAVYDRNLSKLLEGKMPKIDRGFMRVKPNRYIREGRKNQKSV